MLFNTGLPHCKTEIYKVHQSVQFGNPVESTSVISHTSHVAKLFHFQIKALAYTVLKYLSVFNILYTQDVV